MQTRHRDYTINPRSPPRQKRQTRQKKTPLSETNNISYFFPNLSLLPPLPPSTLSSPTLLTLSETQTLSDHHTSPVSSPKLYSSTAASNKNTKPNLELNFPDHTTLPPLPPSPESIPTSPNSTELPSPQSISNIVTGVSRLNLTNITPNYTLKFPTSLYPFINPIPFITEPTVFNPKPITFTKMNPTHTDTTQSSMNESLAMSVID
ncbi:hypothetical protein DFH28DRAFT_1140828 [Melampsora americana]|nr:hypothetical protein DFH28DRAFT_1140828 [Melampsora americana]